MNNETLYFILRAEIPEIEEIRRLYSADLSVWQTMLASVYRQGRVDQLNEWIKTREKGE